MMQLLRSLSFLFQIAVVLSFSAKVTGQTISKPKPESIPKGWHLLDQEKDGHYGISLDKAYDFFRAKNLKSKTVLVAVIDSGIDTLHEDLKANLWTNPGEVPGNGKDDDHNGYIDDIHGWNFLGNKDGKNVEQDSYEGARIYYAFKDKYANGGINPNSMSPEDMFEFQMWKKAKEAVMGEGDNEQVDLYTLKRVINASKKQDSILRKAMNKENFTGTELDTFQTSSPVERNAKMAFLTLFRMNDMMEMSNKEFIDGFEEYYLTEQGKAENREKAPPSYRANIIGDNENDLQDRFYGNGNVMVSLKSSEHGTHVAGIIAAERKNDKGVDGIADNVKIMMVRAVPDGDEHDKDIALAIRYAVDNGARIINMSFGKSFSPQKEWIDEAVKYAESKNVLIIHAAGNDHKNVDSAENYPSPQYLKKTTQASNWITVGSSTDGDIMGEGFTSNFSNYGKAEVDLFAPGSKIYSTVPGGNQYRSLDGTSMASPVVAGTAALLLSYFPYLSPQQLKACLEKGASPASSLVKQPGTSLDVPLTELCKTGGFLNAFESAKIAASLAPPIINTKKNAPLLKQRKD